MRAPLVVLSLVALALLAACSESTGGSTAAAPTRTRRAPREPVDPAVTGTLVVEVVLDGPAPARVPLDVGREPACGARGDVLSEALVAPDGRVANALVSLPRADETWGAGPAHGPARLVQDGCVFRPHVVALLAGRELEVANHDPLAHNVNVRARKNDRSNATQAAGGRSTLAFEHAERSIPVQCDLHPWMGGWVHVLDHPWFGVTGEDGAVRLEDVPAGPRRVSVLHETLGEQRLEVTVAPDEVTRLVVTWEAP